MVDYMASAVLVLSVFLLGRKLLWLGVKMTWRLAVLALKCVVLLAVTIGSVLVYDKATGQTM
jgi:hypothetical protein